MGSRTEVIIVHAGQPMKIQQLVIFYLRAVERFRAHAFDPTGPAEMVNQSLAGGSLAEALNWADTIDQYLAKGPHGTIGTKRDPNWADSVDASDSELVRGFQHARNHVHHQWLNLVATRVMMSEQGQRNEWIWEAAPEPKRSRRTKPDDGRDAFRRQMLGANVLTTLDRLAVVFWARRTWEIHRSDIEQPGYPVRSTLPFDPERDDQ